MLKLFLAFLFFPVLLQAQSSTDIARWKQHASRVEIIRDQWGIPHIYGKTDADAVFGLLYAQCEDDFKRVEMNYIEKLGRLAEVNGEQDVFEDLLVRLVIDTAEAKKDYEESPEWLHKAADTCRSADFPYTSWRSGAPSPAVVIAPILPSVHSIWYHGSKCVSSAGFTSGCV